MSKRYVWDKYDVQYEIVQGRAIGEYDNFGPYSSDCFFYIHIYDSPGETPPVVDGVFDFSAHLRKNSLFCYSDENYDSITISKNCYFAVFPRKEGDATTIYRFASSASGSVRASEGECYVINGSSATLYPYTAQKAKGTENLGRVSANAKSSWPTNGVSGDFWYAYQGSDSIDPAAVAIPDAVKGSDGVIVTVTPIANTYGGTISYVYEYSVDGGTTWTAAKTSTAAQEQIAIPVGATNIKIRVKAKDDLGFTSIDYVYSSVASVTWNTAPAAPSSIAVPAQIVADRGFTLSCGASTDEDANLSGYSWEHQYNGGAWVEFATGAEPSVSTSVPFGTTSVAYRVRAYDADAAYSDYCTGETRAVINNTAPVISGADADLGTFGLMPLDAVAYTVTDVDGGVVNCTVTLDGSVVQSGEVTLGEENSFAIPASQWLSMINGAHVVRITADDEYGATAVRTYTFTKDVAELTITLSEPWITDGMVTRMYILPVWSVPDGAAVQVLATNNALDAEPVWQDVTEAVKLGKKFYFENATKTAENWAVNFKVLADRGTADQVYIKKLTGAFDGLGGT